VTRLAEAALVFVWLACVWGCDNREAFQKPHPGLERMMQQRRVDPYSQSTVFADGRGMREPPLGTRSREMPYADQPALSEGRENGEYLARVPRPLTHELLQAGRLAYDEICSTCHGVVGDGSSVVAQKMALRRPPSFFEPRLMALPLGQIFEVASHGYGLMPGFAATLDVDQRWAVVAYVQALRISQQSQLADLPADVQAALRREGP
jgi:mono/diheme cytochrome c family protein